MYVQNGRVGPLEVDGQCVRATVHGTEVYQTLWEWTGKVWDPDCSCPVGPYCKHAYALASRILGSTAPAEALQTPPLVARRVLPRVQPATGSALLNKLRGARERWARERYFTQLVERAIGAGFNFYFSPFPEILEETDPDLLCWRLAHAIPQRANGWLSPALEPYRDRPDLAERHAQRARLSLATELVRWAEQQRKPSQRSVRLVLTLVQVRNEIAVSVEARLTTQRMADVPRTIPRSRTAPPSPTRRCASAWPIST